MSEQRQPPPTSIQPNQLQQQTVAMTAPMMPTQMFYVSSGNNGSLQHTGVVPPMGYGFAVPTVQNPTVAETYVSRQSIGLGIALIIIGVLTIIFNGAGFAVGDTFAFVGHGIWSGVLFIVTGVFGIVAAKKTKCLIVTFMVFSIISATATGALLALGILGSLYNDNPICRWSYYHYNCEDAPVAMEAVLANLAVFAAIVSIWGSVICCRAVCCCARVQTSSVVTPYGNQQISFVSQQQQNQPNTAVQYGIPQMTPMTFAVSSQSCPQQSAYPQPQPPQVWTCGPVAQPGQQQQYYALNPQQPYGYAFVASSNVDRMPETVAGPPSSVNDPPAYESSNDKEGTSS